MIKSTKINKKKLLCFLMMISFFIIFLLVNGTLTNNLAANGWLGWALLILCLSTWYYLTSEFISPYVFFLILFFLFSFGQSLLIPLNLLSIERNLTSFKYVNPSTLFEIQKYTLLAFICFHSGGIIAYQPDKEIENKKKRGIKVSKKLLSDTGITLLFISIGPYLMRIYKYFIAFRSGGYNSLYENAIGSGAIIILSNLFFAGILVLLVAYRENKKIRYTLYLVSIVSIIPFLFVGKRVDAMATILTLILFQNYYVKKINFVKSFRYIFLGIIIIFLLGVLSSLRLRGSFSLSDIFNYALNEAVEKNMIVDVISELGGSMGPAIGVKQLIDSGRESLRYGTTFLFSIISVIPSLGLWDGNFIDTQVGLANWITSMLNLSFGSGFSIIAESYLNFGKYGILFFIPFSMLLVRIFSKIKSVPQRNFEISGLFVLIFFRFITNVPRDTFLLMVRTSAYVLLPIFLILQFYYLLSIRNK